MKALFLLTISLIIISSAYAMPSFQEVKDSYIKSDAVLLDRHGKVIHELRVDPKGRRLDWISIKDISPALIKAVIHSEDKRFYEHNGVDWIAVGSAVLKSLFTKTPRGASTITMQFASMLDKDLKPKGSKRTLSQKWDQIKAAKEIEKTWSKGDILEAYLNLITFRGELQGISAASRGLFDKEPEGLDEPESFLLASLIRSPNASAENVSRRACMLSSSIESSVRCEDIKIMTDKTLNRKYSIRQRIAFAPHVAYALLKSDKASVFSTLDGELQRFASEVLKHHLMAVRPQNVNDGAVLVVENKTGDVLAYVAGKGEESSARYVDGIKAKRQAGSTLKPFLYAIALEKQILTPASILSDSPLDVSTTLGIYKPENYENNFKGMVSVRTALASSLNVPAVRTLSLIGVESFIQRLKLLGFSQLKTDDYYGLSVALGSADVSLWELVNAYRTLANKGIWSELRLTFKESKDYSNHVFSEEAVFLVSDVLSDREARSATFSLENPLSTRYWSAVKTGTSKDMRDNWCIGYSQEYTVGVWVGNFTGVPMWNVTGITGAAPVWLEIMNYLYRSSPGIPPQQPSRILAKKIEFQHNIEPARVERFIKGTEPTSLVTGETTVFLDIIHGISHITYPPNGAIIALDPDIPEENQRIFFETQTSNEEFEWVLDGKNVGGISYPIVLWNPKHGKHLLSLVDKQNRIVDSVEFEVRGFVQPEKI